MAPRILPIIVAAQFCCTSLWFATNGVMDELAFSFDLSVNALGHLTSAIQFGFIAGTLLFALISLADRFSPSRVFFWSALAGAICNLGILAPYNTFHSLLLFRFLTGFFLAGIYPVGMKIAADYYREGLGKSLGYLVGALVLGTSLPHLLRWLGAGIPWHWVVISTSLLAVAGGIMVMSVPDGPYRKPGNSLELSVVYKVFRDRHFRGAAFGYFGHMWELYAYWTFLPWVITAFAARHLSITLETSLLSFAIIGIGGPACVLGGYASQRWGAKKIAATSLFLSGCCCLLSPLIILQPNPYVFVAFLLFWGGAVVADSPLFSTLVATNSPPQNRGSALTIVNCIGFSITIVSIQLLSFLSDLVNTPYLYVFLATGPLFGLIALLKK